MKLFRVLIASFAATSSIAGAQTTTAARGAGAPGPVPVPRATFIATMETEFRRMDADKNNVLTRKEIEDYQRAVAALEAQQRLAALFQALDTDKNGAISPAEFAGVPMSKPQPNAAPVLAQTDGNRDGSVTLVEYRAGKLVNFDRMDTDKDGVVSPAEMKAAGLIR